MTQAPEGLHAVQYARQIIEEHLGWPSKGNIELVADCLTSIAKTKKLTLVKAHGYLTRAVNLAREQGIEINHFFFSNGEYMNVRPQKTSREFGQPAMTAAERASILAEQATPEWKEASDKAREMLKRLAGMEKFQSKRAGA